LNGPRRQGFASPRCALDRSGPFKTQHLEKGKGATAKPSTGAPTSFQLESTGPKCTGQSATPSPLAGPRPHSHPLKSRKSQQFWPQVLLLRPRKLVLTGGESLLRPDLLALVQDFRRADPDHEALLCLNSNGHLVTASLARALAGLVDEVRSSIDAMQERNDCLRGKGSFVAAINALSTYYDAGFEPKALITVTSVSMCDLLVRYLLDRGIRQFNLNQFRTVGRGASVEHLGCDHNAAVGRFHHAIRLWCAEQGLAHRSREPEFQTNCGVGRFLNVLPDGAVFPCHVLTASEFRCGNVRDAALSVICNHDTLFGSLARLDFRDLPANEKYWNTKYGAATCLGSIVAELKRDGGWDETWLSPGRTNVDSGRESTPFRIL
jgi:hypothetical protein